MVDSYTICPYTGLRSFTEDESLYFKGRDEQIDQICRLLEKNKFLMITGASGEGKSSLVFAGLIPNARAGFFKAKFNNWIVVDFRPERSPLNNMARSLSQKFAVQEDTVLTELRRGYSSLIDLYKNSPFYIDEVSEEWKSLSDEEKLKKKRGAANLLVLVDQFEEFFTNPENFSDEKTSVDSQIVVNLMLETSKISLQKDLPIFVATTMRSDYIGQCNAFRGLPEHIGFSQFFVPRLKRKELKQVIDEPAVLSGNSISRRLVERLVYDISEGVDQLPILQHALSQIWRMADEGREEMDLIHYAMVGGMPANELPEEDQKRFLEWYKTIPEYQHKFYHETGLNRIIEIHASRLYESAWEQYNQSNPDHPITQREGKHIVAMTFACLTKIDHSRAVRNRMSIREINQIINNPEITSTVVGKVIDLFRMDGNSFIRPFITEEPGSAKLTEDTVLDITHESLIRNWRLLHKWADTEYDYHATFLDFRKQMARWKKNGKSRSYLLPIGPLNYFENWYEKCNPNIWWINRYLKTGDEDHDSLSEAKTLLHDTQEFLRRSARKVMVTRAFMRYGASKIATFSAIVIMLALSGFYWYDAEQKKNSSVLETVKEKSQVLLTSSEIDNQEKSIFMLMEERLSGGTLMPYLTSIKDPEGRIGLSIDTYLSMMFLNPKFDHPVKNELLDLITKDLLYYSETITDKGFFLENLNRFILILAYDDYYNPSASNRVVFSTLTAQFPKIVGHFYQDISLINASVPVELNEAISLWLTFGHPDPAQVREMIAMISPFESSAGKEAFNVYYKKGSYEPNGRLSNDHAGGYHMLATLYAAAGDIDGIISSFKNLEDQYFVGSLFNNYNNVIGYLYQYNHRDRVPDLFSWIGEHYPSDTPTTIYRNMIIRSGYISSFYPTNFFKNWFRSHSGYYQVNLCMSDRTIMTEMVEDYEKEIDKLADVEERNFLKAFNLKRIASFAYKYHFDRGLELDTAMIDGWFIKSIEYFKKVSPQYLAEEVDITYPYWGDGIRRKQLSRKHMYIYPDYMDGWFSLTFQSDAFFRFLERYDHLEELYQTEEDLNLLHLWISQAHEVDPGFGIGLSYTYQIPESVLLDMVDFVKSHPRVQTFDFNLLYLIISNQAFNNNKLADGFKYYQLLDLTSLTGSSTKYEYLNQTFFLNQMKELSCNLAKHGDIENSIELIELFRQNHEKIFSYIYNADKLYDMGYNPDSFIFLDSAFSKMQNQDFNLLEFDYDYRFKLIYTLTKMGGEQMNVRAYNVMRDIVEGQKFEAIQYFVWGATADQNYYNAFASIPSSLTEKQELSCYSYLLWEACKQSDESGDQAAWSGMDFLFNHAADYKFFINT